MARHTSQNVTSKSQTHTPTSNNKQPQATSKQTLASRPTQPPACTHPEHFTLHPKHDFTTHSLTSMISSTSNAAARAFRVVATAQRRTLASEVAVTQQSASTVPATSSPAAAVATPKSKSSGPGIVSKMSSFMVGGALSMGVGYWQLQKDMAEASQRVEDAISELRHDTVESQAFLRRRIAQLESGR
jgi:hypothetical protein